MSDRFIRVLQYLLISGLWVFAVSIPIWVLRLATVSYQLHDAFTASVGISVVALPVFWGLAAIMTYTFLGLRRGRKQP